jgi:hypothetical protein
MTQALYAHMNNKTILKKENLQKKKKRKIIPKRYIKADKQIQGFQITKST